MTFNAASSASKANINNNIYSVLRNYALRIVLVMLAGLCCLGTQAQNMRNDIFVFDCTGSMKKGGLLTKAKNTLFESLDKLSQIDPQNHFNIILFGDNVYEQIQFEGSEYDSHKKEIDQKIDNFVKKAKYTNISEALNTAFNACDPMSENKVYLLTDGLPNGGDTPDKVAGIIGKWCNNIPNTRLFYVALTPDAVNASIKRAVDDCSEDFFVTCNGNVIPQLADITNIIHANIEELNKIHNLKFSMPGHYPVVVDCRDSLFTAFVKDGCADNRSIRLGLKLRPGISQAEAHRRLSELTSGKGDYRFNITLTSNDPDLRIANPNVTIVMSDHIQSTLTFGDGDGEAMKSPAAKWHNKFLWCDASPDGEASFDLAPQFKNCAADVSPRFRVVPAAGQPFDFRVFFNGKEISEGESFAIVPGKPAHIQLAFNHDAQEGKRQVLLQPVDVKGIDLINSKPAADYEGQRLTTRYSVVMNPLAKVLMWILIIIAAGLLLWFIIFRRIFFPTFQARTIMITGPQTYMKSMNLRGAREVVLSARRRRQNIFSRIFTGRIIYETAPHFTPEITLKPYKKKIYIRPTNTPTASWMVSPSMILDRYATATLTNSDGHTNFTIQ